MPNTLITPEIIAREALMVIKSQSALINKVNGRYASDFKRGKNGETIYIRRPPKYRVREGKVADIQDHTEEKVPLTLQQIGCDIAFDDSELTLSIDNFSKRVIAPAVAPVVSKIDRIIAEQGLLFSNQYGMAGTPFTGSKDALLAGAYLDENGAPKSNRCFALSPKAQADMVALFQSIFNDQKKIGEQYKSGSMGMNTLGFDWVVDQNLVRQVGSWPGAPVVRHEGGSPVKNNGEILLVGGVTNGQRIRKGTRFRIVGQRILSPQNKEAQELDQWYTVTEDSAPAAGTNVELKIYPKMQARVVGGKLNAYGTILALPAAGDALTAGLGNGSSAVLNMAFHKDAIGYAVVDLDKPEGTDKAEMVRDEDTGLSIRYIRDYDSINDRRITRLDTLIGATCFYNEWGCVAIQ